MLLFSIWKIIGKTETEVSQLIMPQYKLQHDSRIEAAENKVDLHMKSKRNVSVRNSLNVY